MNDPVKLTRPMIALIVVYVLTVFAAAIALPFYIAPFAVILTWFAAIEIGSRLGR